MKKYPILYKYTSKKQVQQWQVIVKDDHFYTEEGIKDGVITKSKPTYCKPKNVGKSNESSAKEQALKEAEAKIKKKIDSGYNEVLSEDKKFFEPMSAFKIENHKDLLFTVRTFIQPKLDGLRCINQNNTLKSRNGKDYLACPHLYQNNVTLDGELYNHGLKDDFNKIVSLCKKQKPTEEELEESKNIVQMWVYDLPKYSGVFSERYEALKLVLITIDMLPEFKLKFKLVPTYEVKSLKEIEKYHKKFLKEGFEGSIIRLDLGPYENKRSKQLLKKKDWIDEEFKILEAVEGEGNRAGTIGKFILDLNDGTERTFESNVKGDFDYLREVWKDRKKYIGKSATVKYFNRTPANKPRFSYIIKISREDYE